MPITAIAIALPDPRRGRLHCPLCGDQRIVPMSLACTSLLGQRGEARIDRDGLHLDPSVHPAEGGSAIAITCRCDHGHLFCLRLRTIYETTTAETVALPMVLDGGDPGRA